MITNGPYSDYSTISMSDESLFLLELDLTLARVRVRGYTTKAPPFQPQATFHRHRVGSAER